MEGGAGLKSAKMGKKYRNPLSHDENINNTNRHYDYHRLYGKINYIDKNLMFNKIFISEASEYSMALLLHTLQFRIKISV